jgi:integration host factor subunit beta
MTKSELIEILSARQAHLKADDVDLAVKSLLEMMGASLSSGERIEVRGFGSFSLHYRPPAAGPQPEDRRLRCIAGQARSPFQAGQGAARTRQQHRARGAGSLSASPSRSVKLTVLHGPAGATCA